MRRRVLRPLAPVVVLLLLACGCRAAVPDPQPGPAVAAPDPRTGSSAAVPDPQPAPGTAAPDPGAGQETGLDLLAQGWGSVAGVAPAADGLHVTATGAAIVEQDGGGGQPNPPLDLAGTHLDAGGDVTLRATLSDVTDDASWAVYDRPPVVADEFRVQPPGLRVTLRGDDAQVTVWDGSAADDVRDPQPVLDRHVRLADPAAPLTVGRSGDSLTVSSGGQTLTTVSSAAVFTSGRLWFGFSAERGSFRVGSFTAGAPAGSRLDLVRGADLQVVRAPDGLQALADRARPGFRIGAALALGPLVADPEYARAALSDFGSVTPENAMKAQFLAPRPGVWTFEEADAVVDLALRHGQTVHGHALAFGEALPRWMQELPTGTAEERRSSAQLLLQHVRTVVDHFRGRVTSWDVVNEPFDVDQGTDLQPSIWYRALGPDYPAAVSAAVYEVDPAAAQFVNENGADVAGPRQDALLDLVLRTNARGGHVTGVGLQAHVYDLDTDAVPAAALSRSLDLFAGHGLQVRISENDVTDDQGTEAQAAQYAEVLAACLGAPNCVSYTTWGVDDRYDWFLDDDGSLQQGHDLLYDDGRPTPAYRAVQRVLGG